MLSRQRLKLAGFCFRYRPVLVIFVGHYCVTPLKFAARYDDRSAGSERRHELTIGGAATCLTSDVQVAAVAVAEVQLYAGDVPGMCCFRARRGPAALAGAI